MDMPWIHTLTIIIAMSGLVGSLWKISYDAHNASQAKYDAEFLETRKLWASLLQKIYDAERKTYDIDRKIYGTDQMINDMNHKYDEANRRYLEADKKYNEKNQEIKELNKKIQEVKKKGSILELKIFKLMKNL